VSSLLNTCLNPLLDHTYIPIFTCTLVHPSSAYDSKNYDAAYFLFFMGELATEPPLTAKFYEQVRALHTFMHCWIC
jgi:hypothetical protein